MKNSAQISVLSLAMKNYMMTEDEGDSMRYKEAQKVSLEQKRVKGMLKDMIK